MTGSVACEIADSVATITLDDGKVNALSPAMLQAIDGALSWAAADETATAVVLTGRDGVFSAGFDLNVMRAGGDEMAAMVRQGFELAHRILAFAKPVVIACSGHAMAMGAFLLLTGDYRIGVAGAQHRIVANEVAIGIAMPRAAIEICRQRLTPAALERAVGQSEQWHPDGAAIDAGWIDAVAEPAGLLTAARAKAAALGAMSPPAFAGTKRRVRAAMLDALERAIAADDAELRGRS
jgi:enoyl-CoA hydratase